MKDWKLAKITVKDLSFEYGVDQTFRLDHVTFALERGKKIALIGPSGSGKTSLVNLLLQFWTPTEGSVSFDQIDASKLDPYQARSNFAVISQSTRLFSASLRENLLLADPLADDERLHHVLRDVELEKWFASLPRGLDTWLGDQGIRLSGGERQRVSIARAILQNRPFVILDEPLENLDPITAKNILNTIFRLFDDRGLLLITHDLSNLHQVDEILVLDNGLIVERGGYHTLVDKGGNFAAMTGLRSQILE
jgi:ABC-type transport system involved in cytochrome bd biosynthesis fused ATPase/permease subunit